MPDHALPTRTDAEAREWEMRCDMAAVFRIGARLGWNEHIGNHNSLMLPTAPGEPEQFLINPRGMLFQELTASSLIVCALDGTVLRGQGELRRVAFNIHVPIHLRHPAAACVLHVHPVHLTALSLLAEPEFALSHHNNLVLNDRVKIDQGGDKPAFEGGEGERIAAAMDGASILVMGGHGVTVVGPTIADAFDELYMAERTCMYQMTAMNTGRQLRALPDHARRRWSGAWGDTFDARLHLNAWRRVLDREEPDYKT